LKTVFFVRHAKSSWEDPSLDDIERPLNKRGLRDAPNMAKMLHSRGHVPDRLLSSPANRALTTAVFFAEAFDIPRSEIDVRPEIYEAMPQDLIDLIRSLPEAWSSVYLFGHNPTFTDLVNRFSGNGIDNVPTCGVVQVEADVDRWSHFNPGKASIKAFYHPKQFFY
jgi:phosphohistidine phosphatase